MIIYLNNGNHSLLVNHHTNSSTIILTNYQPKRPKISDYMIKNYIETCINQYHPKQINHNNENLQLNFQSPVYSRHHPASTCHQQKVSVNTLSHKRTEFTQNNFDIDDDEDLYPIENEQFLTNISNRLSLK